MQIVFEGEVVKDHGQSKVQTDTAAKMRLMQVDRWR